MLTAFQSRSIVRRSTTKELTSNWEQRLESSLKGPTVLHFEGVELAEVIDYIKDLHKIPIVLDDNGLDDVGITRNTPVTCHISDVRLESALGLILDPLGLDWTIRHEVLLITSRDEVEADQLTKVYDVADMLTRDGERFEDGVDQQSNYTALVDFIFAGTSGDGWSRNGGDGTITAFNGTLIVRQNRRVHVQIKTLLDELRQARRDRMARSVDAAKSAALQPSQLLVVAYPLVSPVEQQLARNPGLVWTFRTAMSASDTQGTSPAEVQLDRQITELGRKMVSTEQSEKFSQRLAQAVTDLVEPTTWVSNGGSGEVVPLAGALVVKQTANVHAKIRSILAPFSPLVADLEGNAGLLDGLGVGGFGSGGMIRSGGSF
jgi:hypothetical protein